MPGITKEDLDWLVERIEIIASKYTDSKYADQIKRLALIARDIKQEGFYNPKTIDREAQFKLLTGQIMALFNEALGESDQKRQKKIESVNQENDIDKSKMIRMLALTITDIKNGYMNIANEQANEIQIKTNASASLLGLSSQIRYTDGDQLLRARYRLTRHSPEQMRFHATAFSQALSQQAVTNASAHAGAGAATPTPTPATIEQVDCEWLYQRVRKTTQLFTGKDAHFSELVQLDKDCYRIKDGRDPAREFDEMVDYITTLFTKNMKVGGDKKIKDINDPKNQDHSHFFRMLAFTIIELNIYADEIGKHNPAAKQHFTEALREARKIFYIEDMYAFEASPELKRTFPEMKSFNGIPTRRERAELSEPTTAAAAAAANTAYDSSAPMPAPPSLGALPPVPDVGPPPLPPRREVVPPETPNTGGKKLGQRD